MGPLPHRSNTPRWRLGLGSVVPPPRETSATPGRHLPLNLTRTPHSGRIPILFCMKAGCADSTHEDFVHRLDGMATIPGVDFFFGARTCLGLCDEPLTSPSIGRP